MISVGLCTALASLGRCICGKGVNFKITDNLPFLHTLYFPPNICFLLLCLQNSIIYSVTKLDLISYFFILHFFHKIQFLNHNKEEKYSYYPTFRSVSTVSDNVATGLLASPLEEVLFFNEMCP